MPDPIIFVIKDGVDPQIAQNVAAIGAAAKQADGSVQALTQALQAIQNSGVAGLAAQLSSASSSTTRLSNTTAKMAAAALDASQKIDKLATSYTNLNTSIIASITTLNNFNAAAGSATTGANGFNQGVTTLGRGTSSATGNFIASSAALNVLEGKFTGGTRGAGRFLTSVLGLGPVLQAAFPVFGAIALIGVLDIIISKIDTAITHFKNLQVDSITAELKALQNQQVIIKGDRGFGSKLSNFLDARPKLQDTTLPDPAIALENINNQLRLKNAIDAVNEAGKKGLDLQLAKVDAVQHEIVNTQTALQQAQALRDTIQQQLTAEIKSTIQQRPGIGNENTFETQLKFPKDSPQRKEFLQEAQEVDAAIRGLNQDLLLLQKAKLPTAQLKEPLAAAKDEAKAAAKQLKEFTDQMAKLKGEDHLVSPQEKLDLLLKQRDSASKTHPSNVPALDAQIGAATQAIEHQKTALEELDKRYQDQVNDIGLVSDAQKIAAVQSKIEIELIKSGNDPYSTRAKLIKDNAAEVIRNSTYQKELNKVYNEANEPLKVYSEGTRAILDLEKQGLITHTQALIAQNELNKAYKDAAFPLTEYVHGLQNEVSLLGQYGIGATVASEVQKVQNDLRNKGRALTTAESQQLTEFLTKLEKEKQLQQAVNKLYEENAGAVQKLTTSILALNQARQKGIITEQQYDTQLAKLRVDLANINIEMGKFTKGDVLTSVFGNYIKDFKGLSVGIVNLWQNAFDTIANGAATALGRAIAYGEDLGKALQDVARQALSELITGFIKLGLQLLISTVIQRTAGQTAADASIAMAGAVGAAWAPAAAFASLASFGANAAPADIALGSTVAFAQLLSAIKMNSGGIVPGYGNRDTVPALLTPGEGVLNKSAMRYLGPSTIQAWNKGQFATAAAGRGGSASGHQSLTLNLIHDKNAVDIVQINENTIRVIAKQEARSAVANHTPAVVAAQVANPNSEVRKSLQLHTNVRSNR